MITILDKHDKTISFVLIFAFFLPFFNMPPYSDDIARFSSGYIGLFEQGRFFSEFFILAFNGFSGRFSIDAYPALLLSSLLMCFFTLSFVSTRSSLKMYMITPIVITPYLLENMSYHVDIIFMYISLSISIISSVLCIHYKKYFYSFVLLVCASFFYQVSFSVFASSTVMILVATLLPLKYGTYEIFKRLIPSVVVFVISFLSVMFITKLIATSGYIDNHSTIISLNRDGLHTIYKNILDINAVAFGTMTKPQILICFMMFFVYIATSFLYLIKSQVDTINKLALVLLPFTSVLFIYLPTVVFTNPVIMPRIMMSYGLVGCSFLVIPYLYNSKSKILTSILSISLMATFILCSSAYISSTNYTYNRNISTIKQVELDIENDKSDKKPMFFYGELKPSPHGINKISEDSFPIIKTMTRFPLNSSWLTPYIFDLYGIDLKYSEPKNKNNYSERVKVSDRKRFTLYKTKTHYIAVFK